MPRARARRGPHRPCPRVTNPASRPSRPSGACGRPARGAPRAACRAARGIVSPPLAGFPRARPRPRPPTPRPRAPDAPPSFFPSSRWQSTRACRRVGAEQIGTCGSNFSNMRDESLGHPPWAWLIHASWEMGHTALNTSFVNTTNKHEASKRTTLSSQKTSEWRG